MMSKENIQLFCNSKVPCFPQKNKHASVWIDSYVQMDINLFLTAWDIQTFFLLFYFNDVHYKSKDLGRVKILAVSSLIGITRDARLHSSFVSISRSLFLSFPVRNDNGHISSVLTVDRGEESNKPCGYWEMHAMQLMPRSVKRFDMHLMNLGSPLFWAWILQSFNKPGFASSYLLPLLLLPAAAPCCSCSISNRCSNNSW